MIIVVGTLVVMASRLVGFTEPMQIVSNINRRAVLGRESVSPNSTERLLNRC